MHIYQRREKEREREKKRDTNLPRVKLLLVAKKTSYREAVATDHLYDIVSLLSTQQ